MREVAVEEMIIIEEEVEEVIIEGSEVIEVEVGEEEAEADLVVAVLRFQELLQDLGFNYILITLRLRSRLMEKSICTP